jgi:hypothetical protein
MSDTKKKLEQVKYFFDKMLETYHIPFEFECNLQAFITLGRSITLVMQKEYSKKPDFSSWYQKKQAEMKVDEMLSFFNEARDTIIHEKPLDVGTAAHIKDIYLKSIPKGWSFAVTGKGEPVWISPVGESIHATEFDSHAKRVYLFDNPPQSFLGAQLEDFSVVSLCRLYLVYISELVGEALRKFAENKH